MDPFGSTDQNNIAFGNSNWNEGENPTNNTEEFNAISGGTTENLQSEDVFGFDDQKPKGEKASHIQADAEELAIIEAAQRDLNERLRKIREKEEEELIEKRALQQKAQQELNSWYERKIASVQSKRKQNKEEEWAFFQTREEHKKSKNPWEKIIDNVEIDQRKYLGTKDVTRMRQAMLARKQDLKKSS